MLTALLLAGCAAPAPVGTWSGPCDIDDPWMGSPDVLDLTFTVDDDAEEDGDATVWTISEAAASYEYTAEGDGSYTRQGGSVEVYLAMTAVDYCQEADTNCSGRFSVYVNGSRDRRTLTGECEVSIGGGYGYAPAPGGVAPVELSWKR